MSTVRYRTVRGECPLDTPENPPELPLFPQRGALKRMHKRLLCEARLFLCEVNR